MQNFQFVIKVDNNQPVGNPLMLENFKQAYKIRKAVITKSDVEEKGFSPFLPMQKPSDTDLTKFNDLGYKLEADGFVKPSYEEVQKPSEELDLESIGLTVRAERDQKLASYDWMVSRYAMSSTDIPQEVLDYCQALRDLPLHPNFPLLNEEDWPVPPSL